MPKPTPHEAASQMVRWWTRAVACLLVAGLLSCRAPVPAAAPSAPPAALLAAQHLPMDTVALVVAVDGYGLLNRLGRRALIATHRPAYERVLFELVTEFGHDLLTERGLREVGVEPHGVFGAAWLGPVHDASVLLLPLADAERFKLAVYRHGQERGPRLEPAVVDGVLVLRARDADDLALVVYDELALVVLGHGAEDAGHTASRLAQLPQAQSLAADDRAQQALRGLGAGDVVAYVDGAPLLRSAVGLDPRWHGQSYQAAAERLERRWRAALAGAREEGVTVERLVAIDDEFREARRLLRNDPEANRMRRLIGSLGPAAIRLEIVDNGVRVRGRLAVEPGSLIGRVLRPREQAPVLVDSLARRPALLLQATLDTAALIELAGALGAPLDDLSKALEVDLSQEIQAVLGGPVELALDHDLRLVESARGPSVSEAGLYGVVLLQDAARAKRLLDKLAAAEDSQAQFRRRPAGGYTLELPGLRPTELIIRDRHLRIAPDAAWLEGPLRGQAGGWTGTGHRMLTRLASGDDAAFDGGVALGLPWLARLSAALDLEPMAMAGAELHGHAAPVALPTTNAAATSQVARSDAATRRAELRALDQRIQALRTRMHRRALDRQLRLARQLGVLGVRVRRSKAGFELEAAWVVGDRTITSLLEGVVEQVWPEWTDAPEHEAALERWDLVQELVEQRDRRRLELEQLGQADEPAGETEAPRMEQQNAAPGP